MTRLLRSVFILVAVSALLMTSIVPLHAVSVLGKSTYTFHPPPCGEISSFTTTVTNSSTHEWLADETFAPGDLVLDGNGNATRSLSPLQPNHYQYTDVTFTIVSTGSCGSNESTAVILD